MAELSPALSAAMILLFATQASAEPDHRAAKQRICVRDPVYRDVSLTLKKARTASDARKDRDAIRLLDAGENRLLSYETGNYLSSYHDPNVVVLDDRGLYCIAQSQFGNDRLAAIANSKSCLLGIHLDNVCDEISYKLGYRGGG